MTRLMFWKRVLDFVLPRYCKVCGRRLDTAEIHLCVACYLSMPFMDYKPDGISPAERILLTNSKVVRASSVIHYDRESDYRHILFHLKYWNHPEVGSWLARIGAEQLIPKGFFQGVDCIVPLPLTRSKEKQRGYNQCMYIAQGISQVTGLPVVTGSVIRDEDRTRQATLGKFQRWGNAQGLFKVSDCEPLRGRHILVVDDVMTTGATLCSLIDTIVLAVPDVRISVFTLALAL